MLVNFFYTLDMKNNDFTLFIDLDGTVYDKNNGMLDEMLVRMDQFMHSVLGIPEENILQTRENYYRQYGSTLKGLQFHHEINPEEYLEYIHDLDLTKYLAPDPELRDILQSIPYPKWIFTNSDRNHSQRVLKALGIEDLFEGILDVWAMRYIPKPERWVYKEALSLVGNPKSHQCVFVDDTLMNLPPASEIGWQTVWINSGPSSQSDHNIPKLHYLPDVIDQIDAGRMVERKAVPAVPVVEFA